MRTASKKLPYGHGWLIPTVLVMAFVFAGVWITQHPRITAISLLSVIVVGAWWFH